MQLITRPTTWKIPGSLGCGWYVCCLNLGQHASTFGSRTLGSCRRIFWVVFKIGFRLWLYFREVWAGTHKFSLWNDWRASSRRCSFHWNSWFFSDDLLAVITWWFHFGRIRAGFMGLLTAQGFTRQCESYSQGFCVLLCFDCVGQTTDTHTLRRKCTADCTLQFLWTTAVFVWVVLRKWRVCLPFWDLGSQEWFSTGKKTFFKCLCQFPDDVIPCSASFVRARAIPFFSLFNSSATLMTWIELLHVFGNLCCVCETCLLIVCDPIFHVVEHRHEYDSSFWNHTVPWNPGMFEFLSWFAPEIIVLMLSGCIHWKVSTPMLGLQGRCKFPHTTQY